MDLGEDTNVEVQLTGMLDDLHEVVQGWRRALPDGGHGGDEDGEVRGPPSHVLEEFVVVAGVAIRGDDNLGTGVAFMEEVEAAAARHAPVLGRHRRRLVDGRRLPLSRCELDGVPHVSGELEVKAHMIDALQDPGEGLRVRPRGPLEPR